VCGKRKKTWSHYPAKAPAAPAKEHLTAMEWRTGGGWPNRYAFHFAENGLGDFPRGDGDIRSPRSLAYIQDSPARALDFPALAALSDAFFLRIMHVRGTMQPMATVTLTTYFHVDKGELADLGASAVLGEATAAIFHSGFADQTSALWTPGGKLIANGAQLTWYKE
jgi:hypothetical protein